jgi:hypothetical protein
MRRLVVLAALVAAAAGLPQEAAAVEGEQRLLVALVT